ESSFTNVGDVLHYTLTAKNDGNVTLSSVSISDPKLGSIGCTPPQPATLAPGAELICTGTHTVTQADVSAGRVINTAIAHGTDPVGTQPTVTANAAVPPLAMALAKVASPMTYDGIGQTITYTYTITNTGVVTLDGPFTITDDKEGTITPCGSGPLTAGA